MLAFEMDSDDVLNSDASTPLVVLTSQTGEVVRVKTVEELAKIAQEVSSSVRKSSRRSKRHASRKNVSPLYRAL